MSGIVGVWNLDGRPLAPGLLDDLGVALAHRGPDGDGAWVEGSVGLACRLLRVTPEAARESQPCVSPSGTALVFDGRLDNREDLLASLEDARSVGRDAPDAALVLAAYEVFGERLPERLSGDFALGLFDPHRRQLLLARDAMGVRPLYYCRRAHLIVFASEIKALLVHPDVPARPDDELLARFLLDDIRGREGRTFFEGVSSVPPACVAIVTPGGCTTRRYWDFDPSRRTRLGSFQEYAAAFLEFALRTVPGGTVVACADDPGALQLAGQARERLRGRADVITYGTSAVAEVGISEVRETAEGTSATLHIDGRRVPLALGVPGLHNLRNATAAVVAANQLGVAPGEAAAALRTLGLPGRRLETLGEAGGVLVVDDYAHHPTEIRASIAAMRARTKGRVVACFQPHTASRLRAFFDDFVAALGEADIALVAETFSSARERADREGLARLLAQRAGASYAADIEGAARELAERTAPGDVALILGAGDVRAAGVRLLELLRSRTPV